MNWQLALPALFTLGLWWFSTGAILYVDGLPRRTFKWSLGIGAVLLLLALWGLWGSAHDTTVGGAYCAFACALVVWGWHEMAFLMGVVTGPRRTLCPPGAQGWQRAVFAAQTVLHHELALVAQLGLLWWLLRDAPNAVGLWAFAVLWVMRLSAKLNVFLGVRNLNEKWLPPHLKYLHSYLRQRAANALFPVSMLVSTLAAGLAWRAAMQGQGFEATAMALVATLFSLAALEHVLMVLPLSADALWGWAWRSRARPAD